MANTIISQQREIQTHSVGYGSARWWLMKWRNCGANLVREIEGMARLTIFQHTVAMIRAFTKALQEIG